MKKENNVSKESFIYGVLGVLVGCIVSGAIAAYAVNNNNTRTMRMFGIDTKNVAQKEVSMQNSMSMDDMVNELNGKTGDSFDKLFISEMIEHHQGAIDMAELALTNAKHDEVKAMAKDIIAAQSKEIAEMKSWQSQWGYSESMHDMNDMMHSTH